jgi:hypothetical protein
MSVDYSVEMISDARVIFNDFPQTEVVEKKLLALSLPTEIVRECDKKKRDAVSKVSKQCLCTKDIFHKAKQSFTVKSSIQHSLYERTML